MVVGDRVGTVATSLVHEWSVDLDHEDGAAAPCGIEAVGVPERRTFVHHIGPTGELGEFVERPHVGRERALGCARGNSGHLVTEVEQPGSDTTQVLGGALGGTGCDATIGAHLEQADRTVHATVSAAPIVSTRSRIVSMRSNRSASRFGPAVDIAVHRASSSMISAIAAATATGSPLP